MGLQAVFLGVGTVVHHDPGTRQHRPSAVHVDGQFAEGGGEGAGAASGHGVQRRPE